MKLIYLDNCCFNRPFDDQSQLKTWLETQSKLCIQQEIMLGKYNLAWSYVLDYEIGLSPFEERRDKFLEWKKVAKCFCDENETLLNSAEKLFSIGFKTIDALHTAAAIYMKCDYLVTTDRKMLNKNISPITIVNPIDFLRKEVFYEN